MGVPRRLPRRLTRAYVPAMRSALTLAVLMMTPAAAVAAVPDDDMAAMRQELRALRREVEQLRAAEAQRRSAEQQNWMDAHQREHVKALVEEVLADAETRVTLENGLLTAGYEKGSFFLRSQDENFLMRLGGLVQVRYLADQADAPADGDDFDSGFLVRRARFRVHGHVADPHIIYYLQTEASRSSGGVSVIDAYVGYRVNEEWSIRAGRFLAPFTREFLTSSARLPAVERSYVDGIFNASRVEGVAAYYEGDRFHLAGSFNDGVGSQSTDFDGDDVDFALTARGEVCLAGDWGQYKDFVAWSDDGPSAFVGAAVHYQAGETDDVDPEVDLLRWTADGSVELPPVTLFGAVVGEHRDSETDGNRDRYGFVGQAGFVAIPDKLQPFVRFEHVMFDEFDDVSLITGGVNWFLRGHTAKFTGDVVYALDPVPVTVKGAGITANDEAGQVVLRLQMQVAF